MHIHIFFVPILYRISAYFLHAPQACLTFLAGSTETGTRRSPRRSKSLGQKVSRGEGKESPKDTIVTVTVGVGAIDRTCVDFFTNMPETVD